MPAGSLALHHGSRRLGRDVPGREARATRREDDRRSGSGELPHGHGDQARVVGDDPPLDLEALHPQKIFESVARRILAHAGADTVRDGENGCVHAGSFVFSTS